MRVGKLLGWLVGLFVFGCQAPDATEPEAAGASRQAIIQGTVTPAGLYPSVGALVHAQGGGFVPFCSGALIAPDVVLTAAHCVDPFLNGPAVPGFTLVHDATAVTSAEVFTGKITYKHPRFSIFSSPPPGVQFWGDIALLILNAPVPNATLATLPTRTEAEGIQKGMTAELVGYGQTLTSTQSAGIKHHGNAPLTDVGPWEIAISKPGDTQVCRGDSGGPAFLELGGALRLVGVASRLHSDGLNCDRGALHTRTDGYLPWIFARAPSVPCAGAPGDGCGDTDADGVPDRADNCPTLPNATQADLDLDGIGDACEDSDGDGLLDPEDNCRGVPNADQSDEDQDGIGDACENDSDLDGVIDDKDNCKARKNPDQLDDDGDGIGNACEADIDGDGVIDDKDNCVKVANPSQADDDGDGVGNACEPDSDGDGVIDDLDNCPLLKGAQADLDGDGIGDGCDDDIDGDGTLNADDPAPSDPTVGAPTPPDSENATGCGCASTRTSGAWALWGMLALAVALMRRRPVP